MINIDLFTNILENKKDTGFIEYNEDISDDLLYLFINTPAKISKIQALFKKVKINPITNKRKKHSHKTKINCSECGEFIKYKNLNLSNLIEYIITMKKIDRKRRFQSKDYLCKGCIQEKEKKEQKESLIYGEEQKEYTERETKQYINEILNPNVKYKKGVSNRDRRNEVFNYYIDNNIIQEYIQNMNYKEFLQTIYWSVIASHVKYKSDYKCQLCSSSSLLNTHHKNYDRHGLEHLYWKEDLICLCQDCHNKFHDKINENL